MTDGLAAKFIFCAPADALLARFAASDGSSRCSGMSLAFNPLAAFSYSGTRPVLPRRLRVAS